MTAELKTLMDSLASEFHTTCEPFRKGYSMTIDIGGGRTQTIRALIRVNAEAQQILLIYTPVGKYDSYVDLTGLLARNLETIYARVALLDQNIVVVAGSLLSETSVMDARIAVQEVARFGDRLERELFGVDRN